MSTVNIGSIEKGGKFRIWNDIMYSVIIPADENPKICVCDREGRDIKMNGIGVLAQRVKTGEKDLIFLPCYAQVRPVK